MKRGLLSVLVVAALLVGGAVVAQAHPGPAPATRARQTLAIPATSPVMVCPGPETLVVPAGGVPVAVPGPVVVAGVLSRSGTGSQGYGATFSTLPPLADGGAGQSSAASALTAGQAGVWLGSSTRTAPGGVRLDLTRPPEQAVPGDRQPTVAAAVQASLGRTGDLRGLAATTCGPAGSQAWLVGGGTGTGQRARLVLANPTVSPTVLDIAVHGPDGPVSTPSGQGQVVPAGGVVALFVDALAPGVSELALHLTARSGRFVATLHDTVVRGVTTGGVDDVGPAAAPSRRQVLPGVVYVSPGTAAVRIAVPGRGAAVVRVRLAGPDGVVDLPGGVVTVAAGAVASVPVTGVDDGTYSALVEADVPVVAGAVMSRVEPGGEIAGTPAAVGRTVPPADRAWAASGQALRGAVAIAVPRLPNVSGVGPVSSSMVFSTARGGARFWLREVAADGSVGVARRVSLAAERTEVLALGSTTSAVLVTPPGAPGTGGPLFAALLLQTADASGPMISVVPIRPGPRAQGPAPTVAEDLTIGQSWP